MNEEIGQIEEESGISIMLEEEDLYNKAKKAFEEMKKRPALKGYSEEEYLKNYFSS